MKISALFGHPNSQNFSVEPGRISSKADRPESAHKIVSSNGKTHSHNSRTSKNVNNKDRTNEARQFILQIQRKNLIDTPKLSLSYERLLCSLIHSLQ